MNKLSTVKACNIRLCIVQFAYIDERFKQTRPVHWWSQGTDQIKDAKRGQTYWITIER